MSANAKTAELAITIVVTLLKTAGLGPEADRILGAIDGAKSCIGLIDDIKNETLSDPNRELIRSLFDAMKEEIRSIKADLKEQGLGKDKIESTAAVLIETTRLTVKQLAQDDDSLLDAARLPDSFSKILVHRAEPLPDWCDDTIQTLYEKLLKRVSEEFVKRVKDFDKFDKIALISLLRDNLSAKKQRNRIERGVQDNRTISLETNRVVKELAQRSHSSTPSRVFFGSRPDAVAGERFVERDEHEQLKAVFTDPTQRLTVLVGMRGCGKTQLAASLAKQCEDANWNLVAWINSVSRESIQSDLVELAKQLGIGTSDQPTQDQVIQSLLSRVKSAEPADRLIIFDNVEDLNHLRGLTPSGNSLRVIATTTNNTGWDDHGWNTLKVGVFDRDESIKHLLDVTDDEDHDGADALAERLGDLPIAITQASSTCKRLEISLSNFNKLLNNLPIEEVLDPTSSSKDQEGILSTFIATYNLTFNRIYKEKEIAHIASCILQALCYLSDSGVPTRWLKDEGNLHSLKAYALLVNSSLIQQSHDKAITRIHRLYSYAFRKLVSRNNQEVTALQTAAYCLQYGAGLAYDETEPTKQISMVKDFERQLLSCMIQDHSKGILCSKGVREAMDALLHIQIRHHEEFSDLEDLAKNAIQELIIHWDWNDPAHHYELE